MVDLDAIKRLVEKYELLTKEGKLKDYNEETTKKNFILPLFKALGWDTEGPDVSAEETIKNKRVDYGFKINGMPKFFLEAKSLREEDIINLKYIQQAIDYAWMKSCTWAVLTNFRTLIVYNSEQKSPDPRMNWFIKFTDPKEYLERSNKLLLLSRESMEQGLLDKEAEEVGKKELKKPIDAALLDDITNFREKLYNNIKRNNQRKNLSESEIEEAVQRIIDRLIFIRSAEDRGLEPEELRSKLREWSGSEKRNLLSSLTKVYSSYNNDYDSKLFEPHLCDELEIDANVLGEVVDGLYESKDGLYRYDFSLISADVLGNIYEQYLGRILKKVGKTNKLEVSKAKKKSEGIYYTPTYIVNYIVKNTLGEYIKLHKEKEIENVKILDPACGSGSFLLKAYDTLQNYWKEKGKLEQNKLEEYGSYSRKVDIAKNNIFGVDLDKQAVEIAQLNLLLKIAEKRKRLPILQNNIKCGNSLIDDPNLAGDKAFKWNDEFKNILNEGGFDIIIGNPPYERTLYLEKEKEYYSKAYESSYGAYDILVLFIERALQLLRDNGYLGFIVSNKFLVSDYGKKLRELLLRDYKLVRIVDLADAKRVFPDALVSTVIIIIQKAKIKSNYNIKVFVADKNTTTFDENRFIYIPIDKFVSSDGTFNVRYNGVKDTIYNKLNKMEKFGNVFNIRTGIMGFEYWKMEPFLHNGRKGKADIKIATNSYIEKYRFLWGKEVNLYKRTFIEPYMNIETAPINKKTKELFLTKNKIVIRGVARELTAALDEEGTGFLVAVHSIITQGSNYEPYFVLALLNSDLFNWIHKDRFYLGRIPEGSLKYPVSFLKGLPIPKQITDDSKKKVLRLVEQRLSENSKLSELGDKRTEEYKRHTDRIAKIDNEINEEIYRIYGITIDERRIIEDNLI
jgi:predicted type IV restriction endonuclease/methylase of polypeptide subunit release factors/uncharacterized phage-like protein YoqJ